MSIEKQPYKILFIEDEKEIRDNYTKYLKRHFLNVFEAVDGEDGFTKYKKIKPDIMIVDINMPKITGLELLKKIRESDQTTKVIMLTAYSDTKFLLEASELKLVKYLVKPISRDDLKEALDIAIDEFSKFDVVSKKAINLTDGFKWDCIFEELSCNGNVISLTNKERQITSLLLSNPNRVYSYDDIIVEVWNDLEYDKLDALKTIVKNIRKKLPKDTIKNVFGIGYKF
jgi:two-component system, OmpR family, response regulator VanR